MSSNAKLLQRHAKKKGLTARDFFTSRSFMRRLSALSSGFLKKIRCSIKGVRINIYYDSRSQEIACTNGNTVHINAACFFVKSKKTLTEKVEVIIGILAHELGHVAYTNFTTAKMCANKLSCGVLFPLPVSDSNYRFDIGKDGLLEALRDEETRPILVKLIMEMSNSLEDGYVDEKMITGRHGVLSSGLETARDIHYLSTYPIEELIAMEEEGELQRFQVLSALLLSYAKFGQFRYETKDSLKTEQAKALIRCIDYIDEYLETDDSMTRFSLLYTVIILLWSEISSFLEWAKEQQENNLNDGDDPGITSVTKGLPPTSSAPSGQTANTAQHGGGAPKGTGKSSSGKRRQKIAKAIKEVEEEGPTGAIPEEKNEDDETNEEIETGSEGGNSEEQDVEKEENLPKSPGKSQDESEDDEAEDEAETDENGGDGSPGDGSNQQGGEDVKAEEGGRFGDVGYGQAEESDDEGFYDNEELEDDVYENAASDIERLLDNVADDIVDAKLEDERTLEMSREANSMDLGDIHKNVNITIKRRSDVDDELIDSYKEVEPRIKPLITHTVRKVEQSLKDKRQGMKKNNLYFGSRLEVRNIYRGDGQYFSNKKLPGGKADCAFALLVDESGSMGWGDRATYARLTALILHGTATKLEYPISIWGHTTRGFGSGVELFMYSDFESIDNKDKFRLMDIKARNANRDGAALRFVGNKLIQRPEPNKVLFLVCDGQPADDGYFGKDAEEDLRGIKTYLKRNGVNLIVAAIGDDKPQIQAIYGDSFMDISNPQNLPVTLSKKLLSFINV